MAQISLDLSQFKASGIYTLEYDQSQTFLVNPQTVRLVVGFSKQGPFNAPVFCPDIKTAQQVFGNIDPILERKGSFFHRTLFTCLQTGPVFALNLLMLSDGTPTGQYPLQPADNVDYEAFSINTAEYNGTPTPKFLGSFYDTQRFWTPNTNNFLASVSLIDQPKLLDITNLSKTPLSIITKKSNITGYDITAKEWYTGANLPQPAWLNDDDYISDFFVDVIAIKGDWTNYAQLALDPIYGAYFDANGFKYNVGAAVDPLAQFASLTEVTAVASITGCLIPDFADRNGVPQYIQTLINNSTAVTGLFCAVNEAAFDNDFSGTSKIDLVGHNMISALQRGQISWDFLSYKAPLVNDQLFTDVSPSYMSYDSPYNVYIATEGTPLYNAVISNGIVNGDVISTASLEPSFNQYIKIYNFVDYLGAPYVEIRAYEDAGFITQENIAAIGSMFTSAGVAVPAGQIDIISLYGQYNRFYNTLEPLPAMTLTANQFILSYADATGGGGNNPILIGDLFVRSNTAANWSALATYAEGALVSYSGTLYQAIAAVGPSGVTPDIDTANWELAGGDRLTRVTSKAIVQNNPVTSIPYGVLITCSAPVNVYASNQVQHFQKIVNFVTELNFTYLDGFTLSAWHLPDGSLSTMNNILDVMYNTNIAATLADKNTITWRYVVDTFSGGIEPNLKWRFATLAMKRKQAMALINVPSAQTFLNSTDPVFTDPGTPPLLNTSYIVQGGNPSVGSTWFSLADEAHGSKYAGYFFPNIMLVQNGKNISVPPAALVSNLFIQKFISGNPFAIVAGTRRGLISDPNLVGPEIALFDTDRDNLEPFGINPIVKMRGAGTMIYANQTGYQRVSSALNNLHVRDILITIEDGIEQILANYMFEFNDPSTRLEVKTKVDNYLEGVQSAGALYNFLTIMDTSNNTPDIIDQNVGIIDVIVEPARGMQKIINRVTITRTGQIASGGFTLA